jgi:hypothetical protein
VSFSFQSWLRSRIMLCPKEYKSLCLALGTVDGEAKLRWNKICSLLPEAHHTSLGSGLNCISSKEMYQW